MNHTYIFHATFDTGRADPEGLKDEVAEAVCPLVQERLRTLQHYYAGHDMPVPVTVYAVQEADELAHNLDLLGRAMAEVHAKRGERS